LQVKKSQPGQIVQETLSKKYPTQKRAGVVPQMVECLPSRCETLSSNTSIATKKKKRKKEIFEPQTNTVPFNLPAYSFHACAAWGQGWSQEPKQHFHFQRLRYNVPRLEIWDITNRGGGWYLSVRTILGDVITGI
jgi:hypothetical protein